MSGRTLPEPMQDEAYRDDKTCPGDDKKHSDDPQNVSSSDRSLSDDDDRISHDGQAGRRKAQSGLNSSCQPPSIHAEGSKTR